MIIIIKNSFLYENVHVTLNWYSFKHGTYIYVHDKWMHIFKIIIKLSITFEINYIAEDDFHVLLNDLIWLQ